MKIMKSMILGAVATLIVAAGPEAAAPVVGLNISADAATKPGVKCRGRNMVLKTFNAFNADGTPVLVKDSSGASVQKTKQRCVLKKTRRGRCKSVSASGVVSFGPPMFTKTITVDGQTKTIPSCRPRKPKVPAVKRKIVDASSCKAPRVFRAAGTVIGKGPNGPVLSKANACVLPAGVKTKITYKPAP